MKRYEVIRLEFDPGDLDELNRFTNDGWQVCGVCSMGQFEHYAMLQRELPDLPTQLPTQVLK
jgi:hypothetical protein